jgi:hypothetical protein
VLVGSVERIERRRRIPPIERRRDRGAGRIRRRIGLKLAGDAVGLWRRRWLRSCWNAMGSRSGPSDFKRAA